MFHVDFFVPATDQYKIATTGGRMKHTNNIQGRTMKNINTEETQPMGIKE